MGVFNATFMSKLQSSNTAVYIQCCFTEKRLKRKSSRSYLEAAKDSEALCVELKAAKLIV